MSLNAIEELRAAADSGFAPSHWETALLCNDVSHWLGANLKPVLWHIWHDIQTFSNIITFPWVCAWGGCTVIFHDDVIKWNHFPRYWPFVRGVHRLLVNSPHKGQWRGALMFSLICAWISGWVNNCEAGDLGCQRAHYDVIVMLSVDSHLPYSRSMMCANEKIK